jgi:hypothetical protein
MKPFLALALLTLALTACAYTPRRHAPPAAFGPDSCRITWLDARLQRAWEASYEVDGGHPTNFTVVTRFAPRVRESNGVYTVTFDYASEH